jgi:hypothetical protein
MLNWKWLSFLSMWKIAVWVVCEQKCYTSKRDGLCWDCCCAMIGGHTRGIKAILLCLMKGGIWGWQTFKDGCYVMGSTHLRENLTLPWVLLCDACIWHLRKH